MTQNYQCIEWRDFRWWPMGTIWKVLCKLYIWKNAPFHSFSHQNTWCQFDWTYLFPLLWIKKKLSSSVIYLLPLLFLEICDNSKAKSSGYSLALMQLDFLFWNCLSLVSLYHFLGSLSTSPIILFPPSHSYQSFLFLPHITLMGNNVHTSHM